MEKNRYLIDWLSFTTKIHSPEQVIALLGLEGCTWETIKGAKGYKDRLYFSSISIHYNGAEDMGVWCEMSGQGCRIFETYGHGDYGQIFDYLLLEPEDMHITRLDIAYDDKIGIFDMTELCDDTQKQRFVSKWRKYEVIYSNGGNSILHGSRKSDCLLRIYDKAAEQQVSGHWIRLELQMRDDRAFAFIRALQSGLTDLGQLFTGVIYNYLRYVIPSETDTNNRRWPTADYWQTFIIDAEKISIYDKPGVDYTMVNLEDYVIDQAGNAIKTYIEIAGAERLIDKLKERSFRKNPKYESLKRIYEVNTTFSQGLADCSQGELL